MEKGRKAVGLAKSDKLPRQERAARVWRTVKVGATFCGLVVALDLLVWYLGTREYLAFLDIALSWVVVGLIRVSGLHAVRDSNTIYLTNSTWVVATECTAVFIMIIFAAFVVAYPSSARAKWRGLLAGLPCIVTANILRLFCMAWIDYLTPQYSEVFHSYMWQVVFILMVIALWSLWIERVVARDVDAPVHS